MVWFFSSDRAKRPHDGMPFWRTVARPDLRCELSRARFAVVDTETSSVDAKTASVLSIGACIVEADSLALEPTLELFICQARVTDAQNILFHGIGELQQTEGLEPEDAWSQFLAFAGGMVPVGYHALFDATVIRRHLRDALGIKHKLDWIDVGVILCALFPRLDAGRWELDHWLQHAGIDNVGRHSALSDAFATAQLLLYASAHAQRRGVKDVRGLLALQRRELLRLTQGMPTA